MDSRRLPGKVLADLGGKPLLARVVDRMALATRVDRLIVATSDRAVDAPVAAWADDNGLACFRGDVDDVAGRALACCRAEGLDAFVRISGDSPFIDPDVVDAVCARFDEDGPDIATNVHPRTFPPGVSAEAISVAALTRAMENPGPGDREHVTTAFYDAPARWHIANVESGRDFAGLRLTVDEPADLDRARRILAGAGSAPERLSLDQIAALAADTTEMAAQ